MNESIIILDGVDKTGKDTIQNKLIKVSNGKIMVINRAFISQIVYNRIYNRNINESFFFEKAKQFYNLGVKFIVLTASEQELIQRFIKHDEKDLKINDIKLHLKIFNEVIEEFKNNIEILILDTSKNSIDDIIKLIEESL